MGIDSYGCILLALGALLLPLRWFLGAVLAAAFHELCHAAAARCMGCRVHSLHFGWSGAGMDISPMSRRQELICAAAGPVGSLALITFLKSFPELAVMGVLQGIFNLLPIFPLDGGRIVRCIVSRKASVKIGNLTWLALFLTSMILIFSVPAVSCLLFSFLFHGKVTLPRKSSCKESNPAVQ